MCSTSEEFLNTKINCEKENKAIFKMDCTKDDSIVSVNSQITSDNSRNNSVKILRKNETNKIRRSLTSILFLNNKKILNIKNKFFPEKENSDFDLLIITKKNENNKNEENTEKKIEMKENKIEFKENKFEANENKIVYKEVLKNNVNNLKNINVNKNTCIKTNENCNVDKNIQKDIKKKNNKNDNYTQTYCRNDFSDRPPKVSRLFMNNYDYENKNIFSHSNDTCANIKESKKIPHIFYDHLLINNENNESYITTSFNKRNHGKLSTFIFYVPRNIFA